jgi:dipeptidyl-peptidase-4
MNERSRYLALMVLSCLASSPFAAVADDEFPRQWAETNRFRLGRPASVTVSPNGDAVFFLRSPARSLVRDLYVFERATGKERRLLTAGELLGGGEEQLTEEEKARRERARLTARGLAGFSLSPDGKKILAPLSGKLYLYDRVSGGKETVEPKGFPIDPRFSPDGKKIAYVIDGDLYSYDLEKRGETRLTTKSGSISSNGLAEFAAQEEMDRAEGYWFSPEGDAIAYQQNDDSALETFYIADPANPSKEPNSWRYPRAGQNNSDVKLAIVPVAGGDSVWIEWNRQNYPYLAAVTWKKDAPLTILVQNRAQSEELLLAVDRATGKTRELLRESDSAWLNIDPEMPHWLPGGKSFLWTTERGGNWQLEERAPDGTLLRSLLPAGWIYQGLVHHDEKKGELLLLASRNPLDRGLFKLSLASGQITPVMDANGLHEAWVAEDGSLRVVQVMPPDGKWSWQVEDASGKKLGELISLAEVPAFPVRPEWLEVGLEGADGRRTGFHSVILRPAGHTPGKRWPVIVSVYGGPHKQMVRRDGSEYFFAQWLANEGFVVVSIDGRGTPNRGHAFERAIRGDLIGPPLEDQVKVLQELGRRHPEMDLERVGIFGWSFGGFFSAMAAMQRPDVFKAAVAGAPVSDWELYDTHYTERYLGLPAQDPAAYRRSSVLEVAKNLSRPLLIVHGTADDNVYFVHSLRLIEALFAAGRPFEFLPLAGSTHVLADPPAVERLWKRVREFFRSELAAAPAS